MFVRFWLLAAIIFQGKCQNADPYLPLIQENKQSIQNVESTQFENTGRIQALETSRDVTNGRVQTLEANTNTNTIEISNLKGSMQSMRTDMANMQSTVQALENQMLSISDQINQINAQISQINSEISAIKETIEIMQDHIVRLTQTASATMAKTDRLDSVDQIWRKNFQSIKSTFGNLRQRVQFVLPVFAFPMTVGSG